MQARPTQKSKSTPPPSQSNPPTPTRYRITPHKAYSHSSAVPCVQNVICTGDALSPFNTILYRNSFSLGVASIWLRFCPVAASTLPDHSTSPAALARGQMMESIVSASIVSLQTATSPPRTSFASSALRPAVGSCE